jgi:hypothetical protein
MASRCVVVGVGITRIGVIAARLFDLIEQPAIAGRAGTVDNAEKVNDPNGSFGHSQRMGRARQRLSSGAGGCFDSHQFVADDRPRRDIASGACVEQWRDVLDSELRQIADLLKSRGVVALAFCSPCRSPRKR